MMVVSCCREPLCLKVKCMWGRMGVQSYAFSYTRIVQLWSEPLQHFPSISIPKFSSLLTSIDKQKSIIRPKSISKLQTLQLIS